MTSIPEAYPLFKGSHKRERNTSILTEQKCVDPQVSVSYGCCGGESPKGKSPLLRNPRTMAASQGKLEISVNHCRNLVCHVNNELK